VIALHETPSGISFAVRVQPRARRNAVVGELGGALKIALTAPPVEGRANEACIDFLAEVLDLPRASISIISGQSSRNKVIRITGLSAKNLRECLDLERHK
jgi:uncharacterized protein (TIGR00251 family)